MDQSVLSNALCVVSHVETVDTRDQSMSCFNGSNAMLCQYSRYKMHIHVHLFLPITFLIFNKFSIRKKFWNAGNQGFPTILSNPICRHYRYIGFDGMVGKLWFPAFQNFFRIENPLNIKEVMGRNMCTCVCILYRLYRHNIAFEPLKHDVL